jgi:hypothetical protein
VEKNIPCVYSKAKAKASRLDRHGREPTPCTEALSLEVPEYSSFAPDLSFDMDYLGDLPSDFRPDLAVGYTAQSVLETPGSGDIHMGTFMDFLGDTSSPSSDQWLVPTEGGFLHERPASPVDEEVVRGYSKMAYCVSKICELSPRYSKPGRLPLSFN